MVLRRGGPSRRENAVWNPSSVVELGRSLRRERTRQGLRLEEVSTRHALPLPQLQAIEDGAAGHLLDRVGILKSLRRYADVLGLDGERYVLAMVDLWPTSTRPGPSAASSDRTSTGIAARSPTGVVPRAPRPDDTMTVPAVAPRPTPGNAGQPPPTHHAPTGDGQPDDARPTPGGGPRGDRPTTALARSVADPFDHPAGFTAPVPATNAGGASSGSSQRLTETGTAPAVASTTSQEPATAVSPQYRPPPSATSKDMRAPLPLRIVVLLAVLAVLVGAAGLVINATHPRWLQQLGIEPAPPPVTGPTSTASGAAPRGGATHGSGPSSSSAPTSSIYSSTTSPDGTASIVVHHPNYLATVVAVNGESWVQANTSAGSPPVFSQTLQVGQSHGFMISHPLTVQLGSSSARIVVSVGKTVVGVFIPSAAPTTVSLQTA